MHTTTELSSRPRVSAMPSFDKSVRYFYSLIDEHGIIQFSKGEAKDHAHGYAIEDQARALIAALALGDKDTTTNLINIIARAKDKNGVKMLWDNRDEFLSQTDDFGEASAETLWALGEYQSQYHKKNLDTLTTHLIEGLKKSPYARAWSYALLGLTKLKDKKNTKIFADKLIDIYALNATKDWKWFENYMSFANSLLPWALLSSFELCKDRQYLITGLGSLNFLLKKLRRYGKPITVGNKGWFLKGKEMALYDQQPIDICYLVMTLIKAYEITNKEYYLEKARFYHSWFMGNNLKNRPMIRHDGGCFDGLAQDGPNLNSGAESNICYILSSLALNRLLA